MEQLNTVLNVNDRLLNLPITDSQCSVKRGLISLTSKDSHHWFLLWKGSHVKNNYPVNLNPRIIISEKSTVSVDCDFLDLFVAFLYQSKY